MGEDEDGPAPHRARIEPLEVLVRPAAFLCAGVRECSASAFLVVDEHALCRSGHFITFDDDRRRIERQLE
jgi:hypothetical protein